MPATTHDTSVDAQTDSNAGRAAGALDWLLVVLGLWVLVTPFFLGPAVDQGVWPLGQGSLLFWSNVVAGTAMMIVSSINPPPLQLDAVRNNADATRV